MTVDVSFGGGGTSLSDVAAVALAAVALIATVVLAILGFVIAADTSSTKRKLQELEAVVERDKSRLFGMRSAASTLALFISDASAAIDVVRRSQENVLVATWGEDPQRTEAFRVAITEPLDHLGRLQQYLRLINPKDDQEFGEQLEAIVNLYPDAETCEIIDNMASLLPKDEAEKSRKAARKLRGQLKNNFSLTR